MEHWFVTVARTIDVTSLLDGSQRTERPAFVINSLIFAVPLIAQGYFLTIWLIVILQGQLSKIHEHTRTHIYTFTNTYIYIKKRQRERNYPLKHFKSKLSYTLMVKDSFSSFWSTSYRINLQQDQVEPLYFCHGVCHIRRRGIDRQLSASADTGRRLKKRCHGGSGASVNNGVSSVTEEATIKVSKNGQGKNRHKLNSSGDRFWYWNKT